jgi:ribosomal protein L11 methyltransferase
MKAPKLHPNQLTMYLWRRRATPQWWLDHEESLRARFDGKLAVIEQPNRTKLQLEVACTSRKDSRELVEEFGGRGVKLPRNWLQCFEQQRKPKPLKIGKQLVVTRSGTLRGAAATGKSRFLVIPAGPAFGTGEHATTAMSLRLLERALRVRRPHAPRVRTIAPSCAQTALGRRARRAAAIITRGRAGSPEFLVDVGTGSGILALAASRFGANHIIGIDVDPIAISTAKQNARLNRIDNVDFRIVDVRRWKFPRRIDIVTANLFGELLIEILPKLKRTRWLILSGILREQESDLLGALHRHQINIVEVRRRGKWIAVLALTI